VTVNRIGVAAGAPDWHADELRRAVEAAARAIGVHVERVESADAARGCVLVLALGFPAWYPWLVDVDPGSVVTWYGEPLPPPGRPALDAGLFRGLPSGRLLDAIMAIPGVPDGPTSRLRLLRELLAWTRPGRRVVVTSRPRAAALAGRGLRAEVVPYGYQPGHAGPLVDPDSERDIPVLFLGTLAKIQTRRSRLLEGLQVALAPDVTVTVEPGPIGGEQRTALLRRARIVVDVQRVPGNFAGLRILLAGAGGAAYVSEPIVDSHPFVAGVDHVEASADKLPSEIRALPSRMASKRPIPRMPCPDANAAEIIARAIRGAVGAA
jgi:hypothetical protein